jgi:RNA chaperone ProQ/FINO-like protein
VAAKKNPGVRVSGSGAGGDRLALQPDYPSNQVDKKQNFSALTAEDKNNHSPEAIIQFLAGKWRHCFFVNGSERLPLKVGIFQEIVAALNGTVAEKDLSNALRSYCASESYLLALTRPRARRVGLNGRLVSTVTAFERNSALAILSMADQHREQLLICGRYEEGGQL